MDALTEFEALFHQYEGPICSYLAQLTGDLARAQELAQETFLRAYRAMERGERWDNPRAWLYRVASRLAANDYRRRKLLRWLPLRDDDLAPGPGLAEAAAERLAFQAALDTLPPRYRAPLVLSTYAGYRVAEIADVLDLGVSAVKMRLSRGRVKFRRAYERQGAAGPETEAATGPTMGSTGRDR
jgi:RNA polymerase sigma-70 factor (ECF subfamily)